MKFESKHGIIFYHDTPWNDRTLDGKTLEIDSIVSSFAEETLNLVLEFCTQKLKESYKLIMCRISASQLDLKKTFFLSGFITVEHTLNVSSFGLDLQKLDILCKKFPVHVEDYRNEHINEVEDISSSVFKFGRFYEDPFIEVSKAKDRNRRWISDLVNQDAIIKVLIKKNKIVGFMAYEVKEKRANLILGGIKEEFRHLAFGFWANILSNLKNADEIHTLISSSNIDVLNLYSYFGFRFEQPQFGLHKYLLM
jgi:hypothetical protein